MALRRRSQHSKRKHHRQDDVTIANEETQRLAEKLAPAEEKGSAALSQAKNGGSIIVDTGALKLPGGFVENENKKRSFLDIEPVAIVIILLMLGFIAFIAYLISQMPPAAK
jgi:hypothetical protein